MGSAAATPPRHLRSTCGGGRIARHSAVRTVGECTKRSRWPRDRRQRHARETRGARDWLHWMRGVWRLWPCRPCAAPRCRHPSQRHSPHQRHSSYDRHPPRPRGLCECHRASRHLCHRQAHRPHSQKRELPPRALRRRRRGATDVRRGARCAGQKATLRWVWASTVVDGDGASAGASDGRRAAAPRAQAADPLRLHRLHLRRWRWRGMRIARWASCAPARERGTERASLRRACASRPRTRQHD